MTESQCRPLHGACRTVRFCGPTHRRRRRLAMSCDARQRGPREALELGQYTLMIETCLKVGAPWLVPLSLYLPFPTLTTLLLKMLLAPLGPVNLLTTYLLLTYYLLLLTYTLLHTPAYSHHPALKPCPHPAGWVMAS